jgi:hypothetical protein
VNDYTTWVRTLDFVAVTDADLDNDTFESALKNSNKITTNKISGLYGLQCKLS